MRRPATGSSSTAWTCSSCATAGSRASSRTTTRWTWRASSGSCRRAARARSGPAPSSRPSWPGPGAAAAPELLDQHYPAGLDRLGGEHPVHLAQGDPGLTLDPDLTPGRHQPRLGERLELLGRVPQVEDTHRFPVVRRHVEDRSVGRVLLPAHLLASLVVLVERDARPAHVHGGRHGGLLPVVCDPTG